MATEIKYLRTVDERYRIFVADKYNPIIDIYDDDKYDELNINDFEDIKYGDIVYAYSNQYIYTYNNGFIRLPKENLILFKSISKYIENPITFYKKYEIIDCFHTIELSTKYHMPILRQYADADSRDITIDMGISFNYDANQLKILFKSARLYDGNIHLNLELTSETLQCYLLNTPFDDYDPITIEENTEYWEELKARYENSADEVFRVGNTISFKTISKNFECGQSNEINDIKYDETGKPSEIIIKYRSGISGINEQEITFLPYYNKYIGIPEWICKNLVINPEYTKLIADSPQVVISSFNFK